VHLVPDIFAQDPNGTISIAISGAFVALAGSSYVAVFCNWNSLWPQLLLIEELHGSNSVAFLGSSLVISDPLYGSFGRVLVYGYEPSGTSSFPGQYPNYRHLRFCYFVDLSF